MDDPTVARHPDPGYHPTGDDSPLLRWVATLTCLAAAAPVVIHALTNPGFTTAPRLVTWGVLFVLFVASFWLPAAMCRQRRRALALLAVQTVLAVALFYVVPSSIFAIFLVIVAAGAGGLLPLPLAALWVTAQTAALLPAWLRLQGWADALILQAAFLGFQLFAVVATRTAERERRARAELAAANAELRATREKLAESSRAAERLRIARDLHDVVGHHLTALSLNLEAARHAEDLGEARRPVETAHGLARRLLAEVRRVVGRLRDDEPGGDDLAAAFLALTEGIDRPRVHLRVPEELRRLDDPEHSGALLRCAREMLTNSVRHARAENLWLELERRDGGLELTARDDGLGGAEGPGAGTDGEGEGGAVAGYGLTGMRERLERLGGYLRIDARPGEGFQITAWLPTPQ